MADNHSVRDQSVYLPCAAMLLMIFPLLALRQAYTINTVAGGGLPVNVLGTEAGLGHTYGVAKEGL